MTTIQKSIEIPPDHQVRLDLSLPDVPAGNAEVLLIISSTVQTSARRRLGALAGRLANSRAFSRDAVTIQREIRDEW